MLTSRAVASLSCLAVYEASLHITSSGLTGLGKACLSNAPRTEFDVAFRVGRQERENFQRPTIKPPIISRACFAACLLLYLSRAVPS